jgi:hypothetical protein
VTQRVIGWLATQGEFGIFRMRRFLIDGSPPVEKEIGDEIDSLVQRHVEIELEKHTPQALRDELAESERKLEELERDLHNSSIPLHSL